MSAYIYGLVCASLAIGFFELLLPEKAAARPYLKLLFGLAMLLLVIKPVSEAIGLLSNTDEWLDPPHRVTEYEGVTSEELKKAYTTGVSALLEEEMGLKSFSVFVVMGEDNRPARITVVLYRSDIFRDPYKIEERIGEVFGCECLTVVG